MLPLGAGRRHRVSTGLAATGDCLQLGDLVLFSDTFLPLFYVLSVKFLEVGYRGF